jgi:hypothetical protein
MAMGMTYEQFWDGEPSMCKAVRKAHKLRQEMKNQDAWIQGMYIYEAIADLVPVLRFSTRKEKAVPYRDKPYDFFSDEKKKKRRETVVLTEEEKQRKRDDDRFNAYMTAWMSSVNKKYEQKQGKEVVDDAGRNNEEH